jgi:hypothetical protein
MPVQVIIVAVERIGVATARTRVVAGRRELTDAFR